jgi:hypothetical protein
VVIEPNADAEAVVQQPGRLLAREPIQFAVDTVFQGCRQRWPLRLRDGPPRTQAAGEVFAEIASIGASDTARKRAG